MALTGLPPLQQSELAPARGRVSGPAVLLEGPIESDYSLAIVNRNLALALGKLGHRVCLRQRDNTVHYEPGEQFLASNPKLAEMFQAAPEAGVTIHSRYIYPPYTDRMLAGTRVFHCYGWEESAFPRAYANLFNRDLDLITVMSTYVKSVLEQNGVRIPVVVVGLGADHVLDFDPVPTAYSSSGTFDFLHISSCFPRKGVDVLVAAFCEEFDRSDDVRLVIKTFPNPHNDVEAVVREWTARHPRHAPILVVMDSLGGGEMRHLMENAGCVVSPSRGEGFGLPVAEAMLLGRPVIATVHSGQADLCSEHWCWPVEFDLRPARTHLTEGASFWAEPSRDSLRRAMRSVFVAGRSEVERKTERARRHVLENFTWERVAERHYAACCEAPRKREETRTRGRPIRRLGFVSSWNTRCGIAEYTRYLAGNLEGVERFVFASEAAEKERVRPDESFVTRCWRQTLEGGGGIEDADRIASAVLERGIDALSFQYNFGFLTSAALEHLTSRLQHEGVSIYITLHATAHPGFNDLLPALRAAELTIVHRHEEVDRLRGHGVERAVIQRQGIAVPENIPARRRPAGDCAAEFTIACFGFFLPPKGIRELLAALRAAVDVNPLLRMKLLDALYPNPDSEAYAAECTRVIHEAGLGDRVTICTAFLTDRQILEELSEVDLVVLPYTHSTESSSAAVRLPLASLTPLLCSDLHIFDEFRDVIHRYCAGDTLDLARQLIELSQNPARLRALEDAQRQCVERLSWRRVGAQFQEYVDRYRRNGR